MVTPSIGVTGRHAADPKGVPCDITAGRCVILRYPICIRVVGSAVESSPAMRRPGSDSRTMQTKTVFSG